LEELIAYEEIGGDGQDKLGEWMVGIWGDLNLGAGGWKGSC
jgi:hypothetical protein